MQPNLFIASSTEGLEIAEAMQLNLQHSANVTIWSQGFFELSRTVLEDFEDKFVNFDFAALAFTLDDEIKMRGKTFRTARDNVILELGFAIGRLGRERTFIVTPRPTNGTHMVREISNLLGIKTATYDDKIKNRVAALGPATTEIKNAMQKRGLAVRAGSLRKLGIMKSWDPIGGGKIKDRLSNAKWIRIQKTWFPEDPTIEEGLTNALENGAEIHMLLCDPYAEVLKIRSIGAGENPKRASGLIVRGIKIVYDAVAENSSLRFSIWLYKSWPGCPVIWADDQIYMGFYFRGKSSPKWPWIEVAPKSTLARILEKQWGMLRKGATVLEDRRKLKKWLSDQGEV